MNTQDRACRCTADNPKLCEACLEFNRRNSPADPVKRPAHYIGKVECIDAIEAAIEGKEAGVAYLVGQCIKYLFRLGKKDDAIQDAKKCQWYLERLIRRLEQGNAV